MEESRSNNDIDLAEEEFYIIKVIAPENCVSKSTIESIRPSSDILNNGSGEKTSNENKNSSFNSFTCDFCRTSFNEKSLLILHFKETHVEIKKTKNDIAKTGNVCDKCSYSIVNSTLRKRKFAVHGNKKNSVKFVKKTLRSADRTMYAGDKCNIPFSSVEHLKKLELECECRTYKCDKCTYTCYKQAHMSRHMTKHTDKRLFPCSMCTKVFKTKIRAAQHENNHSISFPCDICGEKFDDTTNLRFHSNTHKKQSNLLCDVCGLTCFDTIESEKHKSCLNVDRRYGYPCRERFADTFQLKQDVIKEHGTENIYSCGSCDYITLDESILNVHINSHCLNEDLGKNGKYECAQCDYSTFIRSYLKKHALKHSEERPFRCSKCALKFKSKETLGQHEEIHNKHFKCSVCEEIFESLSKLKKHIFTHEGIKDMFNCSECGFISSTETEIDVHKESHDDAKKYVCDECGLRFKYPSFLKRHQRQHLRSVVMFSCSQCSYGTTRSEAFKKHMSIIHQETVIVLFNNAEDIVDKHHLCEFCEYTTGRKSNLMAHILTHVPLEERKRENDKKDENEKYFCNQCNYTSPKLINLRNHLRCHTNGEKFSCNKCPFSCKLLKYLKQHELTHTEVKPHLCDLCTRSFRKGRDLKKHAAVHENKDALQCDLCDYICLFQQGLKKHKRIVHKVVNNNKKCDDGMESNSDMIKGDVELFSGDKMILNIRN